MNKGGGSPKDATDPATFSGVGEGYNAELGKLLPKYLVPSTKENWEPVTLKQ